MNDNTKKILLGIAVSGIILTVLIIVILLGHRCKPHCSGIKCGSNSSDGCGGNCTCNEGGVCQDNGICCYPNCKGLSCSDDGCGGKCSCNAIPGGSCIANSKCVSTPPQNCSKKCKNGECLTADCMCVATNICCYKQDHNNYYCGPDGCGGMATCQSGSTCTNANGPGICANGGKDGWKYNIRKTKGIERKNASSVTECAQWIPKNITLDLQNLPCKQDSDCPYGENCQSGYCNRNNVFQYWYYDPLDESGYNCTKILAGSNVCGVPKNGASGFDVIGNVGPDANSCKKT